MQYMCRYLLVLLLFTSSLFIVAQESEPGRFGISASVGLSNSNNKDTKSLFGYGFGIHTNFNHKGKFSGQLELEYDVKKEHFSELKNYYYNSNGEITTQYLSIKKSYGLLDLKYNVLYELYAINKVKIMPCMGVGFNTLFWLGTKIESNNMDVITNGKTQINYTNPLTRPSFVLGPAINFPYDKDKLMTIKAEYQYDYRLPNSINTYPNFNTLRLKIQIIL